VELNDTTFQATASLAVKKTATITANVGPASSGLDVAGGASFTVADGALITIVFAEAPGHSGVHWGLRWAGDHAAALQTLVDDGKLTWDDTGLGAAASIITDGGYTYVGVAVNMAEITQFSVADSTSGSSLVTNAAAVAVTIAGTPAEGATIDGYVINETGVQPTDGWAASLTSYDIQAASGSTVTLHGWMKDSAGNVAHKTTTIYFNTTAPAVLTGPTITDNGDGTATAVWTTDITAEGSVKYGPVSLTGATPNVAVGGGLGTSHSATLTGIAAGTNYKIVVVNTEVAAAPVFWPRPWPIEGDANQDCRVNILDLIFIRNKLNLAVGTGDNWKADVNEDTRINILDLIYVRNKLNTQCP